MAKNWYLYCQPYTWTKRLKNLEQSHPVTSVLVQLSCLSLLTAFACYLLGMTLWIIQKLAWISFYLDIALWIIQEFAWIIFYQLYPGAFVMIGIYFAYKIFPHTSAQWFGKPDRISMEERVKQRPGRLIAQLITSVVAGQLLNVFVFSPFLKLMTSKLTNDPVVLMIVLTLFTGTLAYGINRQFFLKKGTRNDGPNVNTCAVCLANERTILLKPCKHFCMCAECAVQLTFCPVCNTRTTKRERIYST